MVIVRRYSWRRRHTNRVFGPARAGHRLCAGAVYYGGDPVWVPTNSTVMRSSGLVCLGGGATAPPAAG